MLQPKSKHSRSQSCDISFETPLRGKVADRQSPLRSSPDHSHEWRVSIRRGTMSASGGSCLAPSPYLFPGPASSTRHRIRGRLQGLAPPTSPLCTTAFPPLYTRYFHGLVPPAIRQPLRFRADLPKEFGVSTSFCSPSCSDSLPPPCSSYEGPAFGLDSTAPPHPPNSSRRREGVRNGPYGGLRRQRTFPGPSSRSREQIGRAHV